MEIATLTTAITTLIFSEALKEGGKGLGKEVSEKLFQLIDIIRDKFRTVGTEDVLKRAQSQPTESNQAIFKAELETQINEDETFTNQLQELIKQLESSKSIRQVMASDLNISGELEAGDMNQKATPVSSIEQEILKNVNAQNVKLGNLTQEI